ncbi:MAG TPA: energy transducer TonB [Pyrinomonadaceae bacterium]|jgi:TonB family protein|nr:energy transducer TonB [Pyrinomonadaceae bacterium]
MSNLTRTLSLLLIFVCAAAVGLAQEKNQSKENKAEVPPPGGAVREKPLPIGPVRAMWQEYKSESGDFSIMFPGTPQEETSKRLSGRQEVTVHFLRFNGSQIYSLMHVDSPTLLGMNPEATQNLLDAAVKKAVAIFHAALKEKERTLEQKKITLDGHPGISCVLRTEDGRAVSLRVYAIWGRFYQLIVLTPSEEGAAAEQRRSYEEKADKFFDSFKIAPPVVVSSDDDESALADPAPPAPKARPRAPISGGILNGKAVSKPNPAYPAAAREAGVSGTVEVAIVVDEDGRVISAEAVSGPEQLRAAAVEASRKAHFTLTRLSGQPVKVSGLLTYNFVLP